MFRFLSKKWVSEFPQIIFRKDYKFFSQRNISFGDPSMPDKLYKTITLEIKSSEPEVLRSYSRFVKNAAECLNINLGEINTLPKPTKRRFTVLKSVFVHRKHLVQYEIRTHYLWMNFNKLTGSTADTFLEYIERMLPEGVGMKVTKVSAEPMPSHLSPSHIKQIL